MKLNDQMISYVSVSVYICRWSSVSLFQNNASAMKWKETGGYIAKWIKVKHQWSFVELIKGWNKLPRAAYTVPTSNLKEPTTVPDRSRLRECKTYKIHSHRPYPKSYACNSNIQAISSHICWQMFNSHVSSLVIQHEVIKICNT